MRRKNVRGFKPSHGQVVSLHPDRQFLHYMHAVAAASPDRKVLPQLGGFLQLEATDAFRGRVQHYAEVGDMAASGHC